jgi:2-polyprenyl-6-methoxyphenol hydroxylase-like FAD-dependent oxidoreductase
VKHARILVVGGGIGGLTATIALRQRGFEVHVVERDPSWSVYGVGIIQQPNVIRAMSQLGILSAYINAGFGFDHVDIYSWDGVQRARLHSPKLVEGCPANLGISRIALHKVLGERAIAAGGSIRLGESVARLEQSSGGVDVQLTGGSQARYDLVIGADGTHSNTRQLIFPEASAPEFTGQAVWRYNFERPAEIDGIRAYQGPIGVGLVPLAANLMYMFATTPEPGNPRYAKPGIAERMRGRLDGAPPAIASLAAKITDDESVVYRPLEWLLLTGPWHKGRVVLLGDAVHCTTPHLGQGAGLAIEDSLVLADELAKASEPQQAFEAYRQRRFERCRYIVETSVAICNSQLGRRPPVDQAQLTREMLEVTGQPI